jgi:NAD+ synthase (glutamine-hydrolysing)
MRIVKTETNYGSELNNNIKRLDTFKVAVAQIKTDPGKIEDNLHKCIQYIEQAKEQGAKLIVFPEATIPAYCSMDLLYNRTYIKDNLEAIQKIKEASKDIIVVIGFVDTNLESSSTGGRPKLYNSAGIFKDGELVAIQDKSLFPNYEIFFEDRYFSDAREQVIVDLGTIKLGTTICEDIWANKEGYEKDPTANLVQNGADLIVNLSASPFHIGKFDSRSQLISELSAKHAVSCIYANLVGSYDGFEGEIVFDGRSLVTNSKGDVIGLGKSFSEDLLIVDIFRDTKITLSQSNPTAELHDALILGIQDYLRRVNSSEKPVVIGLSGGIDSALVAALAVKALGPDRVIGVTMPSKYNSSETKGAAYDLAENLGIKIKTLPIQIATDTILNEINKDSDLSSLPQGVAEENVQARLRMINLMYYANKLHAIVLNTGNKTELAMNNCTIYGDMVGGFSVLGDVDKDRVYELSRYINDQAGKELIPEFSIVTPPSAELAPNQLDAHVMGDDPARIAPMIRDIVENGLTMSDIKEKYGEIYSESQLLNVLKRLDYSEWKRRQASPSIRVTPHAFGQGRRIPISHGYYK